MAAGGIADERGLVAALALGAQAGWLGTRFLTASEAATHEVYRQAVIRAAPQDAVHVRCFDGGWPNAPRRALRNSTLRAWEAADGPTAPNRPGEGAVGGPERRRTGLVALRRHGPRPRHVGRRGGSRPLRGQSAGLVHDVAPAGRIVSGIAAAAPALMRQTRAHDTVGTPSTTSLRR
ncbi:nitronate monooxygenase [Streptomyces sp. N2A]|uniref:nitronate monooxygenase n=1 Tax=Streptomyces sp. N2A TaxID=3073936 RepID=UPI0037D9B0D3